MNPNTLHFVLISPTQFQFTFFQKLLTSLNAAWNWFATFEEASGHFHDYIQNIDIIFIEIGEIPPLLNFLKRLEKKPGYHFKRYPIILIGQGTPHDSLQLYFDLGAHYIEKPFAPDFFLEEVNKFLNPPLPRLIFNRQYIPSLKKSLLNIRRTCLICKNTISLLTIDPKNIYQDYDEFFLPVYKAKEGYVNFNLGDEIFICPYCLFSSTHRHDFYSDSVDDCSHSILYTAEKAIDALQVNYDQRFHLFNSYFKGLSYHEKKELGILGSGGDEFFMPQRDSQIMNIVFTPPRPLSLRKFLYQLLLLTHKTLQPFIYSEEKQKLTLLESANNYLKLGKIHTVLNEKDKTQEYYQLALDKYIRFLDISTSYYVLYRTAYLISILYDIERNHEKRLNMLQYLGQIFSQARQAEKANKEKIPKALLDKAQDLYAWLRR